MIESSNKDQGKKKAPQVKTYPVPFVKGEIIENFTVETKQKSNLSKEKIIYHAYKYHSKGNILEASKYYKQFIENGFKDHRVFSNYGALLQDLNKLEEAEILQHKAIELEPKYAQAHSNIGYINLRLNKLKEAEISFRKAIEINPNFADAYSNLGIILKHHNQRQEAEKCFRQAIKLNPNFADAYYNMGVILNDLGQNIDAIKNYQIAIKLDSNLSKAKSRLMKSKIDICDWSDQENEKEWLKSLGITGQAINPWDLIFLEDDPVKHLQRAREIYKRYFVRNRKRIASLKNKLIHVGYFSSDFRSHPTMYLLASILKLHDKSKFKVYLYSFAPKEDEYTKIAKNCGCIFRDIKESNIIEAVELARNDKLDIAIDLMGYIKYNRMPIFSYRVAPIQINYLGYPGSLGADTIDYIIADRIIIPKENEHYYSEKIIRMPNSYQCNNDKKEICKETISKKDFNLPEKGFIFTCFNNNYKITHKEFDIWMKLLREIKGSVLWLYESNDFSKKNLLKEALNRNVDPKRLIFAKRLSLKKHLARHSLGDLALDTFNCNGHTTTSDALWAGLPVLTKIGNGFAARVSASLLTAIGLPELITYTEQEYENKALCIARNPDKLLNLKSNLVKLRETSSLYNSNLFTQNLEDKFRELVN